MKDTTGERVRYGATFGCAAVVAVTLCVTGCQDSGTSLLSAAQRGQAPRNTQKGYLPPDAARTFTLEFEAPDQMLQRRPDGTFVVTAFHVGFFDGPTLVRALEIPRSIAEIDGTRVRLQVPMIPLPAGSRSSVGVRVRGLSSGPLGQWSAEAGSVTLPVLERPERARRARDAPRPARRAGGGERRVTLEQLNGAPALRQALAPLLRGASEEETAGACATIQDLATAVVLSRKHDLALPQICGALRDRADGALAETLKKLKPSIDVTRELRVARAEARALVRDRPRGRQ